MSEIQGIRISDTNTEAIMIQMAMEQNLLAAELHEVTARSHRAAAQCHCLQDSDGALQWAAKAHIECNDAFNATIVAHKWSAGDHSK